jgi:hypothetical protein
MFFSGNSTISPFVLLTAIEGFDALMDINFVDAILPDASSILQKWPKEPNDAVKEEFAAEVCERMLDAMPNVMVSVFLMGESHSLILRSRHRCFAFRVHAKSTSAIHSASFKMFCLVAHCWDKISIWIWKHLLPV